MNSVRSNQGSNSLKFDSCTLSGCKDVGNKKFEFVARTGFLSSLAAFLQIILFNIFVIIPDIVFIDSIHITPPPPQHMIHIYKGMPLKYTLLSPPSTHDSYLQRNTTKIL